MKLLVASLVLVLALAMPAAAGSSGFTGAWDSIDVDGSYQQLFIGGGTAGVRVQYLDHGATLCHRLGAPNGIATIHATGTVEGSTLTVSFAAIRCGGGIVFDTPGGGWTFTHDSETDTLVVDFGPDENGQPILITWHRIGKR